MTQLARIICETIAEERILIAMKAVRAVRVPSISNHDVAAAAAAAVAALHCGHSA